MLQNYFRDILSDIRHSRFNEWTPFLEEGIKTRLSQYHHGKLNEWIDIIHQLDPVKPETVQLGDVIRVGEASDLNNQQHHLIETVIKEFHPWRKGPFELFGHFIDCEWRSDWKWARIENKISALAGRNVLDIGCGNGYHLLRMRQNGAKMVLGVDPSQLFFSQFQLFKYFNEEPELHLIPIGFEHLPTHLQHQGFDTVFSMGVLYHRKSPFDFLNHLKTLIRPGGELILETLVIEGNENEILVPKDRYAQMRNVWFLPSVPALMNWMKRIGFDNIQCIDCTRTTTSEQRKTANMTFQSLSDFLDPDNPELTIEGYPAPLRATIKAISS